MDRGSAENFGSIEKLAILIPEHQKTSFLNVKAFENNEGFLKVEEECEEERK